MTEKEEIIELSEVIQDVIFQATEQYLNAAYADTPTDIISLAMRIALPKVSTAMVAALAETAEERAAFLKDFTIRVKASAKSINQHPVPMETMQ
jgi:hypothetical protein